MPHRSRLSSTRALLLLLPLTGCGTCTPSPSGEDASTATADAAAPMDAGRADASMAGDAGGRTDGGGDGGAGTPTAQLTTTSVMLGNLDCGSTAPAPSPVQLGNTGTAPLQYTASLAGQNATLFALSGNTSGTVAPGATGTLSVTLVAPWNQLQGGQTYSAQVNLATNDPARPQLTVPVSATIHGANVVMQDVDLGVVGLNAEVTRDVAVQNTGDRQADVVFSGLSTPLAVRYPGSPAALAVAPGGAGTNITVAVQATAPGPVSQMLQLSASGAVCSAQAMVLVRADARDGQFTGAADLDFGLVPCGTSTGDRMVTVGNSGASPFQLLTATLGKGAQSPFTLGGFTPGMQVAPGGQVLLTVTPLTIPYPLPDLSLDFGDILTLTTSIQGDTPHLVRLAQRAQGAVLIYDTDRLDFGDTPAGTSITGTVRVQNVGNGPATVTTGVAPAPFVGGDTNVAVPPGEVRPFDVQFSPAGSGSFSGFMTVSASAGTQVCRDLPPPVALSGAGVGGGITVSPLVVVVDGTCGTTPPNQTVTVSNSGAGAVDVSVRMQTQPSAYELSVDGTTFGPTVSASLAQGATLQVTLRPNPVGSAYVPPLSQETLLVTTNLPGDQPHPVDVVLFAVGARLGVSDPGVIVNSADIPVENRGNVPATVSLMFSSPLFTAPSNVEVPPLQTVMVPVTFSGMTVGDVPAVATLVTNAPLCDPAVPVALVGRRLGSQLTLDRSTVAFDTVACNLPSPVPRTVTLTNTGNQGVDWAYRGQTQNTLFEVLPLNGTLAPGQSVELRVAARPLTPELLAYWGRGRAVEAAAIEAGNERLPLTLSAVVTSASVGWPGGQPVIPTRVGQASNLRVRLWNAGNMPAFVSATSSSPAFQPGLLTLPPFGSGSLPVVFTPSQPGTTSTVLTLQQLNDCAQPTRNLSMDAVAENISVPTVSAPSFQLGSMACGGTATAISRIQLTNGDLSDLTFTASITTDYPFTLTSPASGTLPGGQSTFLEVTAQPLPARSYILGTPGGVIVATSRGTFSLPLDVDTRGVDLQTALQQLTPGSGAASLYWLVRNYGGEGSTFSATLTTTPGLTAQLQPTTFELLPYEDKVLHIYTNGVAGTVSVNLHADTPGVHVCSIPPFDFVFP